MVSADNDSVSLTRFAAEASDDGAAQSRATGGSISAHAAKAATATIPIVFNVGGDPIKSGLIVSFNRPGGNLTGVNTLSPALEPKRLGLLRELVPQAAIVAVLLNQTNPDVDLQRRDVQAAVGRLLADFVAKVADVRERAAPLRRAGAVAATGSIKSDGIGSNVVWAVDDENAGSTAQPVPVSFREPRRLLSSTRCQSSSGDVGL